MHKFVSPLSCLLIISIFDSEKVLLVSPDGAKRTHTCSSIIYKAGVWISFRRVYLAGGCSSDASKMLSHIAEPNQCLKSEPARNSLLRDNTKLANVPLNHRATLPPPPPPPPLSLCRIPGCCNVPYTYRYRCSCLAARANLSLKPQPSDQTGGSSRLASGLRTTQHWSQEPLKLLKGRILKLPMKKWRIKKKKKNETHILIL